MNQKTNLFRSAADERFFPATDTNHGWNPLHKHILPIDLKEFGHQFVPALFSMTDRASEHNYLSFLTSP